MGVIRRRKEYGGCIMGNGFDYFLLRKLIKATTKPPPNFAQWGFPLISGVWRGKASQGPFNFI